MTRDYGQRHEIYRDRLPHWLEAWDCYRSGRHYLHPGRPVGQIGFVLPVDTPVDTSTGTEIEQPRRRSRFEYVPVDSYLWSHVRESIGNYNDRKARAVHIPLFRSCVDAYTSATLRIEPSRGDVAGAPWEGYWANVDLRGTAIGAFMRHALTQALVFGLTFAVTDKTRRRGPAPSRAHELAQGVRAYTYLVSPVDVLDWSLDPVTGQFRWVCIRDCPPDSRAPGESAGDDLQRVRVWLPDRWELYERKAERVSIGVDGDGAGQWEQVDGSPHPVGEVPVSILFARRSHDRRDTIESDSMLAGVVRQDRSVFNLLSMLHEIMAKQGFSQTYLPNDNMGGPSAVDVGPDTAILYNAERGAPLMLTPESSLILAYWATITNQIQLAKETARLGRGKSEYSKEERSAAALQVESRGESDGVASLAEALQEFDHDVHRHVAAWEGAGDPPKATYNRNVTLQSLDQQLDIAERLSALIPGDATIELKRALLARSMREAGIAADPIAEAISQVEEGLEAQQLPAVAPIAPPAAPVATAEEGPPSAGA